MSDPQFKRTDLWQESLAPQKGDDPHDEYRSRLRSVFLKFRDRAGRLADEISNDLTELTLHDQSHIDRLWELADRIKGDECKINPCETFVLGGAFLLHDLGMALAAYPGGMESLKKTNTWKDKIKQVKKEYRNDYGEDRLKRIAKREVLRSLHAERAEQLAFEDFENESGTVYRLIEDPEIRESLGVEIGRIAHSHWWSVDELRDRFGPNFILNPPPGFPEDWQVDSILVSGLLRVADASHISGDRAPGFLRALRNIKGISKDHWIFQDRLNEPIVFEDRLQYKSGKPFDKDEAEAWWLLYDTIQMIDDELTKVDSLLSDLKKRRFNVKKVSGADSPERLNEYVKTNNWTPVDTSIEVSNVADIVVKLGGSGLYGNDLSIPIREMIQNASDAVRARRLLDNSIGYEGRIIVRIKSKDEKYFLEIIDTGIGMSKNVLCNSLLDFGESFWRTKSVTDELPGLVAKDFSPTGQFGIGFFSIFMLGNKVDVISRRYDKGYDDTLVLEFSDGPGSRPLLRKASSDEQLPNPGTKIIVELSKDPEEEGGILDSIRSDRTVSLGTLVKYMAPCSDVSIYGSYLDENDQLLIEKNDWKKVDDRKLLDRIWAVEQDEEVDYEDMPERMEKVYVNEEVVGRMCVSNLGHEHNNHNYPLGVVVSGGLRATFSQGITGIIKGDVQDISRHSALPSFSPGDIYHFLESQESKISQSEYSAEKQMQIYPIFLKLHYKPEDICIALDNNMNGIYSSDVIDYATQYNEIKIVSQFVGPNIDEDILSLELDENVIVSRRSHIDIISSRSLISSDKWPEDNYSTPKCRILPHSYIIYLICDEWNLDVTEACKLDEDGYVDSIDGKVGQIGDNEYTYNNIKLEKNN